MTEFHRLVDERREPVDLSYLIAAFAVSAIRQSTPARHQPELADAYTAVRCMLDGLAPAV